MRQDPSILHKIKSNRALTAFFAIITICIFYLAQVLTSWRGLSSSGVRSPLDYIDQQSILHSAQCFKLIGLDVYKSNILPTGCGGFLYSVELLRILNFTHLSTISSSILGIIFMWATVATMCYFFYLIKIYGKIDNLVAFIALSSPGIWLLLERGNYDELIFIVLVIGSIILTTKFPELGVALIAATALMKFYTLPVYFISIYFLRRKSSRLILMISSFPLTAYVVFLIRQASSFPSTWNVSFGLKSFGLYIEFIVQRKISSNFHMPSIISVLLGLMMLILIYYYLKLIEIKPSYVYQPKESYGKIQSLYTSFLVTFLSCYFAGMNFDYRLIYLASMIAISPALFAHSRFRSLFLLTGLGSLLFSTYSFGLHGIPALLIQFIGDIALYGFVGTQLILLKDVVGRKEYFKNTVNRVARTLRN